jgi:hypothetical protein
MKVKILRLENISSQLTREDLKEALSKTLTEGYFPRVFQVRRQGTGQGQAVVSFVVPRGEKESSLVDKINSDSSTFDVINEDGSHTQHRFSASLVSGESMILLDESSSDPEFDCYFLHGITGDPIRTFTCKPKAGKRPTFWPTDLLMQDLSSRSYHGRYWSFGYSTFLWRKARSSTTKDDDFSIKIERAGIALLDAIRASRPPGCNRPIFFVCHSMGGLIVSQSIVSAFGQDATADRRAAFAPLERSLFKGVAFFGTPFKGSWMASLADLAHVPLRPFGFDNSQLKNLKGNDQSMQLMLDRLNTIRGFAGYRLPVLIFREENPVKYKLLPGFYLSAMVRTSKHIGFAERGGS